MTIPLVLMMTWCCQAPAIENHGGVSPSKAALAVPSTWFGPVSVKFDLAVDGSPYDASANDVRVKFKSGATEVERIAYYDGSQWNAVLLAPTGGVYEAAVVRNGAVVKQLPGTLDATRASHEEFVRVGPDKRSFITDSGASYWPLGHCFAWQGGVGLPTIPSGLHRMAQNGSNWSRIWSCTWDGKNPWWPNDHSKLTIGDMWQPACQQWDAIAQEASADHVRFQWVLFHHGEVSSMVDANWSDNPWNRANGGFLATPQEFFTNARAKSLSKNYLRYVVARYSHQTGILGWELFNEVENTDSAKTGQWANVEAWHREMADYLKSIDPYQHPILTSSDQRGGLVSSVDVCEPHGYPSDVGAMLLGATINQGQPYFFGEVGLGKSNPTEAEQRKTIRDAIWAGYLAGHSGAGQFWYWDVIQRLNLDDEFKLARGIFNGNPLHPGPSVVPVSIDVAGDAGGALILRPGISWGASTQREFKLPAEGGSASAGKMSSFLQGTNHADMGNEFKFTVTSATPGKLNLQLGTVSKSGAHLHILVDGSSAVDKSLPAGNADTPINTKIQAEYPSGTHEVIVRNDGPDWVTVDAYTFAGLGKPVDVVGAKDGNSLVIRIQSIALRAPHYRLHLGLTDGGYNASSFDLVHKTSRKLVITVKNGWFAPSDPITTPDALWLVSLK